MTIEFTDEQQDALDAIKDWHGRAVHGDGPQVFRLFGYAGTGKTTLAKEMRHFATKVQYAALTGKAALVLQRKGCGDARTIHSMIYRSMDKSKAERDALKIEIEKIIGDPSKKDEVDKMVREVQQMTRDLQSPSFHLNPHAFDRYWDDDMQSFVYVDPPDLICIDECSMVDKRIGQDLESFKIPILVLGDPAQLPPISGGGYFTGTADRPVTPDKLLTDIHRQAANNPVLQLATRYRLGQSPALGSYGDSRIIHRTDLPAQEWLDTDQILCGRNATRHIINRRIRQLRGFEGILPVIGERLVCLRNNHDLGLLNGSMWEVLGVEDCPEQVYFKMQIKSADDEARRPLMTLAHKKLFLEGPDAKWEDMYERRMADEFDFGYAITTHKAQGSEWSTVIYVDEWPRGGDEKARHRYTGVTRASDRITVVKW